MANDAQVRVLRFSGHEYRIACDLCGPLTPAKTQADGIVIGRDHLQREHGGGSLALSFAPSHHIPPPIDRQVEQVLDRLEEYLRAEIEVTVIPDELVQICSDLLEASGRWLSLTPKGAEPPRGGTTRTS